MTFLEAAIEVLRREGKPLQVRRLAELAIQHNLLSVVGRDPAGTMQARLDEVLDKGPTHGDLLRVRPDLYGLRAYPPQPYPPPREHAAEEDAAGGPEGEVEEEGAGDELAAGDGAAADPTRKRRRRRRGRGKGPHEGSENGAASASTSAIDAPVTGGAAAAQDDALEDDTNEADVDAEFDVEADGSSTAPLMVATAGDEELTRSGEEREVRSEILGGRREERARRRRDQHGRGRERKGGEQGARPPQDQPPRAPRPESPHRGPSPATPSVPVPMPMPAGGERRTLAGDLVELLRANDARPQHVRALAQDAERRKILDGRPQPEIVREVRMALHGEIGARTARGLRPRLRALGGGNYAVVDRKLDDELLAVERALELALDRQAAATAVAVRRKLARLSPFSFEQLGRCVAESLGVERPTLVRRGEGVAYFGGERTGVLGGALRARVLIGVRTGEAELGRRAVGELRAGLDARGFDEGLLIGLGRLSAEGREELRAGRAVTVYDGESLPALLIERRLGVRVTQAPVPYLDLDFFAEINET